MMLSSHRNNRNGMHQDMNGTVDRFVTSASVAVILCYYNGHQYIAEQIRSILNQSHRNIKIFICDDCSTNPFDISSLDIPAKKARNIIVQSSNENVGFCRNFLESLTSITGFDYYAFADQDDAWHENKIEMALEKLSEQSTRGAALYCGRTTLVDETGDIVLGKSPLFTKKPSFANALVQSIGGGNTIVFNHAARDVIVKSTANNTVVSHDWWCYQIMAGTGGRVVYDGTPFVRYRQHSGNLVGTNKGWRAILARVNVLSNGRFRSWNDINLVALSDNRELLLPENQKILDDFIIARNSALFTRLRLALRAGIFRQTLLGNIGLFLSILMKKA